MRAERARAAEQSEAPTSLSDVSEMVKLEDAVIARYTYQGESFEILVDPNLAMELKKGNPVNFDDLLAIETVFKDAKKGEEKSTERVKQIFHTNDIREVAKKIIVEGEVQLTTQQRRDMLEAKRKEIIAMIAKYAMNPQTKTPHPPQRIELAMNEAKVSVDLFKSAKEQMPGIVKEIKRQIPISIENVKIAVKIPPEFSGKGTAILHKYGIQKEEWQNDGSLIAVIDIPAGIMQDLFNEINHLTHGTAQTKMLESRG